MKYGMNRRRPLSGRAALALFIFVGAIFENVLAILAIWQSCAILAW